MLKKIVLLAFLTAVPLAAADLDGRGAPATDPVQLLDRVAARYAGCVSTRMDGEVTRDDDSLLDLIGRYVAYGRMQSFFTVEFSRRGQSRFVFTNPDGTRLETRGGEHHAVFIDSTLASAPQDVTSWSEGLNVLEGPTSGASAILRELLFGVRGENSIRSLSHVRYVGSVKIGRVPAFVISGRTPAYAIRIWIARDNARLLRVERTRHGAPATAVTIDFIERTLE